MSNHSDWSQIRCPGTAIFGILLQIVNIELLTSILQCGPLLLLPPKLIERRHMSSVARCRRGAQRTSEGGGGLRVLSSNMERLLISRGGPKRRIPTTRCLTRKRKLLVHFYV